MTKIKVKMYYQKNIINLKTFKEPFFVRDFPYSVDMLLDNFMDPNIPFAHHGLQGHRSDGSPIPMNLKKNDTNTIEVSLLIKLMVKQEMVL